MYKTNNRILFIIVFICFQLNLIAQQYDIIVPPTNIKSIVLKPNSVNSYIPIVKLGERFTLSFDDLDGDQKYYNYKIEHCDYDWNKTNLSTTEYLTGYSQDRVRNSENSFNTVVYYTHYNLEIPNKDTRIKISGNYIISIIDEQGDVLFSRKFIVYQPKVDIQVSVHRSRDINFINEKQDVEFSINHPNLLLRDPKNDIKVAIYQNLDWNSVIKNLPPKYIRGSQLIYNYVNEISFWAGNEFLYFDTKEIRNATNNIAKTRLLEIFNTYLFRDVERYNRAYTFNPDANGNFVLRTIDADDVAIEGDYSLVHFALESYKDIGTNDIYIYGSFNNWLISEENKLKYNEQTKLFETSILLKQGFYNYTYIGVDNFKIDQTLIDGSFYQAENEYTVIAYFKQYGDRYQQVVGVGKANSDFVKN